MLVGDDGWLYLVTMEQKGTGWSWSGKKRVTVERQSILTPTCTFSPDGRRVVFVAIENVGMSLHVVDTEIGDQRIVVAGGKLTDLSPAWSPDGRRIGYSGAHLDEAGQRAGRSGIYTIEADAADTEPAPVLEEVHPPEILRLRLVDWR